MQVKYRLNVKLKILRIITGEGFAFCARRIVHSYFRAKPSPCSTCGLIFNPHIVKSILYSLHYVCQRLHLTLSAISEKCEIMLKGKPKVRSKKQDIDFTKAPCITDNYQITASIEKFLCGAQRNTLSLLWLD